MQIYGNLNNLNDKTIVTAVTGETSENGATHVLLTPHQYRAKLYFLNTDGKWIDVGTGYFRVLPNRTEE
jgi:hypothetical protein